MLLLSRDGGVLRVNELKRRGKAEKTDIVVAGLARNGILTHSRLEIWILDGSRPVADGTLISASAVPHRCTVGSRKSRIQ